MEPSANHKLNYYPKVVAKENDQMLGALISQKSGIDFMQNCDLPPPLKVFTGLDKAVEFSMNRAWSMGLGRENDKDDQNQLQGYYCRNEGDQNRDEKLELLKALRFSQTRAREAERKAASLAEEKERISNAFVKDSLQFSAYRQWVRLLDIQVSKLQAEEKESISNAFVKASLQFSAYRQWVRLLEIEVSKLQSQLVKQEKHFHHYYSDRQEGKRLVEERNEGGTGDEMSWLFALALCLGIASVSVGFAFGCRHLF